MKFSELKEKNRSLAKSLLHWMSVAAQALAKLEIAEDKIKRQAAEMFKLMAQSRKRGDELQRLRGNESLLLASIRETAYERNYREDIGQQLDKLAKFIVVEIPGEPSESEGAVEVAIRLLRKHVVIPAAKRAAMLRDPKWRPSAVRAAMDEMNELIKTLPEKKFLRAEPLQLVILRALKRMHSSMELHKSFDTTIGRLVEAEEQIEELTGKLNRAADVQQSVVETLNDAMVGQPEFNEMTAPVEERAAVCLARLARENSEKMGLSFTLTSTVGKQAARIAILEEQLAAEIKGRKDTNFILFRALEPAKCPEHMDSTDNPVFYANRAAQTINVIRKDNQELRIENRLLRTSINHGGFPRNGTCRLDLFAPGAADQLELTFKDGKVTQLVAHRLPNR